MQLQDSRTQVLDADGTVKDRQPWWLVSMWIISGLLLDWRCAFMWLAPQYASHSNPVLLRTGLIALSCAATALLVVRLMRERLRDTAAVFFVASLAIYGHVALWIRR